MPANPIITVENVSKQYHLGMVRHDTLRDRVVHAIRAPLNRLCGVVEPDPTEFWALRDVNFEVNRGEVLGIIGRNGAGKSTLLKILSRITEPTTGRVSIRGRVASLLEVGTGFHPELTGRENIFLNGAILGMARAEIRRNFDKIVAFAEVEQFINTPVKHYSSGMYVRLAFAVAAHLEPEILIVDEVLAVGDAAFQRKCLGKIDQVAREDGRAILFVSHNLQQVRQLCTRTMVLQNGRVLCDANVHAGLNAYHQSLYTAPDVRSHGTNGQIRAVQFVNDTGASIEAVSRQDRLGFILELSAHRSLQHPLVAMAISHGDGQPVFSEHWVSPHPLAAGRHRLNGWFDAAALRSDSYFITVFFYDGETCLDRLDNHPLPQVNDPGADPIVESRRWGVARVPVTWKLHSV